MPRSVIISTPFPTLEEVGKSLGISKRRQAVLLDLVRRQRSQEIDKSKVRRAARPSNKKPAVVKTTK